jgi:nucleoside-diphosphate-sugar epimerase
LDRDDVQAKLSLIANEVTHVFYVTWVLRASEEENIKDNSAMLRNLLDALVPGKRLQHLVLGTGTKHYLGPFDKLGTVPVETPFKEDTPRLPYPNFYYNLENITFEYAKKHGFNWSVARPFDIIGFAPGNVMNLGQGFAVYATICKHTGRPFVFPGSPTLYNSLTDASDAGLIAEHHYWEATDPKAKNEAYNVVNGDVFRYKRVWRLIAEYFGIEAAEYPGHPTSMVETMKDAGPIWEKIVGQHGLKQAPVEELAPWWFLDATLGRPIEAVNDMNKSREHGFLGFRNTEKQFMRLFDRLREEKYIP